MSDNDISLEITRRETQRLKILSDERMAMAKQRTERITAICVAFIIVSVFASIFGFWAYTVYVPDPPPPDVIQPGTIINCEVVTTS